MFLIGIYKVPGPHPGGGKFIKSVREEYQVCRGEGSIKVVRKNIKLKKKNNGKKYILRFNIKAVGKNIKWGR